MPNIAQVFEAFSIIRAPICITLLVVVVLTLPPQTGENYRVMTQDMWLNYIFNCESSFFSSSPDCGRFELIREATIGLLGVGLICAALWLVIAGLVHSSDGRLAARGPTVAVLVWSPRVLITVVLAAAALGVYNAIPYRLDERSGGVVTEVAKRAAFITTPASQVSDSDIEAMGRVVQRLTLFSEMLLVGACVLAGVALAAAFLVPRVRVTDLPPRGLFRIRYPGVAAFALFCVLLLLFLLYPVALPQFLGPLGVFSLFSVCLLLMVGPLSIWSDRTKVPFITILVIWVAIISFLGINNNHDIRTLTERMLSSAPPAPGHLDPPTLKDSLKRWFASRDDAPKYMEAGKRYPVYIVAAPGGGIYAAYHSARLLASLHDRCPRFGDHLFAISGVSGGSVGASLFAALRLTDVSAKPGSSACQPSSRTVRDLLLRDRSMANAVSETLARDMLSPLLAGMLFPDFLQRFLPFPIYAFDRARWLEQSFEEALSATIAKFAIERSGFWKTASNHLSRPYMQHWSPEGRSPALLFNTTEVSSGEPRVMAPFVFGASQRLVVPLWDHSRALAGMSLGTAAIVSARFPWLTPSASFVYSKDGSDKQIQLVDGGYYDNSGVATAIELKTAIETAARELGIAEKLQVKLIVLTADLVPGPVTTRFNELLDPVRAMLHSWRTRSQHTIDRAREVLTKSSKTIDVMRVVRLEELLYPLPLGWRLAAGTMYLMDAQDPIPERCAEESHTGAAGPRFDADCLLNDLLADLL
jgi:hypothetical protein